MRVQEQAPPAESRAERLTTIFSLVLIAFTVLNFAGQFLRLAFR